MWLKDFLPEDVKNVRVMTYGYHSRYERSGTILASYLRSFIQQLENSRRTAMVCKYLFVVVEVMRCR